MTKPMICDRCHEPILVPAYKLLGCWAGDLKTLQVMNLCMNCYSGLERYIAGEELETIARPKLGEGEME